MARSTPRGRELSLSGVIEPLGSSQLRLDVHASHFIVSFLLFLFFSTIFYVC